MRDERRNGEVGTEVVTAVGLVVETRVFGVDGRQEETRALERGQQPENRRKE